MEKIYIFFAIATILGLIINSVFGLNNPVLSTLGSLGIFVFAQSSGGGSQDESSKDDQKPEPEPEPEPVPIIDSSC